MADGRCITVAGCIDAAWCETYGQCKRDFSPAVIKAVARFNARLAERGEAEYASWFPISPCCSVCDAMGAKYRPIMRRESPVPVCDRCFIAWYEGAGTDRASIRKSLGLPADRGGGGKDK